VGNSGERQRADRLTFVSGWCCARLDRPVLLQAGDSIWIEDKHLMVERANGGVTAHP
jgi:hypothetical protein